MVSLSLEGGAKEFFRIAVSTGGVNVVHPVVEAFGDEAVDGGLRHRPVGDTLRAEPDDARLEADLAQRTLRQRACAGGNAGCNGRTDDKP